MARSRSSTSMCSSTSVSDTASVQQSGSRPIDFEFEPAFWRKHMKILMVLTSHDRLGNTGRKTGFWLEEFAAPYFVFRDAGVELTLASPKGGQPPIDPKSDLPENQTAAMARFKKDSRAQQELSQTLKLSDVKADD